MIKRVGLFVGIDKYRNGIAPLHCAVNDAKDLSFAFAGAGYQVEYLQNEEGNCDNIRAKMKELLSGLSSGDIFVFYFAGHGREINASHYLVGPTAEADPRLYSLGSLEFAALCNLTDSVPGLNRLFILDCCRNNILSDRADDYVCSEARDIALSKANKINGNQPVANPALILCSCASGEKSYENLTTNHGYFTETLLRSIKDNTISSFRQFQDSLQITGTPGPQNITWNGSCSAWKDLMLFKHWEVKKTYQTENSNISKNEIDCRKQKIEQLKIMFAGEMSGEAQRLLSLAESDEKNQNFASALRLWDQAIEKLKEDLIADADNQFSQGEMCIIQKSYHKAIKWWTIAARNNHIKAQYNLGVSYLKGEYVTKDNNKAKEYLFSAAKQNLPEAQCLLGDIFLLEEKYFTEAIKWYRLAADQNHAEAQFALGCCYYNGEGVIKDCNTAVKWYRLAAEQNHASAQHNLGCCYYNGDGVPKSYADAAKWLRLAANQNHEKAAKLLETIETCNKTPRNNIKDLLPDSTVKSEEKVSFIDSIPTGSDLSFMILITLVSALFLKLPREYFFVLPIVVPCAVYLILYKLIMRSPQKVGHKILYSIIYLLIFFVALLFKSDKLYICAIFLCVSFLFGMKDIFFKIRDFQNSVWKNVICTMLSFCIVMYSTIDKKLFNKDSAYGEATSSHTGNNMQQGHSKTDNNSAAVVPGENSLKDTSADKTAGGGESTSASAVRAQLNTVVNEKIGSLKPVAVSIVENLKKIETTKPAAAPVVSAPKKVEAPKPAVVPVVSAPKKEEAVKPAATPVVSTPKKVEAPKAAAAPVVSTPKKVEAPKAAAAPAVSAPKKVEAPKAAAAPAVSAPKKVEAPKAPVVVSTPAPSMRELEKRFETILYKAPLKFELRNFFVAPSFSIQGKALTMRVSKISSNTRIGLVDFLVNTVGDLTASYEFYPVPYDIDLRKYFSSIYVNNGYNRERRYVNQIMRNTIINSNLGMQVISSDIDQTAKLRNRIFRRTATPKNIAADLDELEREINDYKISRYVVLVNILSYAENHKQTKQSSNKVEYDINSNMLVEVTIFDNISQKSKIVRHELTTRTPGIITFNGKNNTVPVNWNRTDVFRISAEKLGKLLIEDFKSFQ